MLEDLAPVVLPVGGCVCEEVEGEEEENPQKKTGDWRGWVDT